MAHANRIRVLVLHDDPVARAGLSTTLSSYPDFEVVNGEAPGDASAIRVPPDPVADVVVADYDRGIGLALRATRRPDERLKIMVVASSDRECDIRSALECGVRGYVLLGGSLEDLACGVRAVHRGARHLSSRVAQRLADSLSWHPLTAREEQVLRLVSDGQCNKAIAKQLGIAIGTVKSHMKGIFEKLDVESRTQAMRAAERRGLLREPLQSAPDGDDESADASGVGGLSSSHFAPQEPRARGSLRA
jgi:two-component system response regulator DesR